MVSMALSRLQKANDAVWMDARRDLSRVVSRLPASEPGAMKDALFDFIPPLVDKHGDVAATVAADWFEEFRASELGSNEFSASLSDLVPTEQVNGRLGFLTRDGGPVALSDYAYTMKFLEIMVNEYVLKPGHDTIMENSFRDGAGWARVPEAGACDWCLMLASRGFKYSKETVGDTNQFHGKCRCHGMPVWDETKARVVHGYDPDGLYEQYLAKTRPTT